MKTTIDIPDDLLSDVLRTSGEKTKHAAILAAMEDYRRRGKMASVVKHLGTFKTLVDVRQEPAAPKGIRPRRRP
jgi:Arc/MetJ family transcription regulator